MSGEAPQDPRQPGPFDGSWGGDPGQHGCRITHLSPSGYFVDGPCAPPPGSTVTMTVLFGDTRFTVPAQVIYLDPVQGFGARFLPPIRRARSPMRWARPSLAATGEEIEIASRAAGRDCPATTHVPSRRRHCSGARAHGLLSIGIAFMGSAPSHRAGAR